MIAIVIGISLLLSFGQENKAGTDKEATAHKAALTESCNGMAAGRTQQCSTELIWFIKRTPADQELANVGVYLSLTGNKQQKQQVLDAWVAAVKANPGNADVMKNAQTFDGMSKVLGAPGTHTEPSGLLEPRAADPTPAPVAKKVDLGDRCSNHGEVIEAVLDPKFSDEALAISSASQDMLGNNEWKVRLAPDGAVTSTELVHAHPWMAKAAERRLRDWKHSPVPHACLTYVEVTFRRPAK